MIELTTEKVREMLDATEDPECGFGALEDLQDIATILAQALLEARSEVERLRAEVHKEHARMRDALKIIRRAQRPDGCCLLWCASWSEYDCDCGYVDASDDLLEFVDDVLSGVSEPGMP